MATALRIITQDEADDMIATWNSAAWFAKEETVRTPKFFVFVKPKTREPFFIAKIDAIKPVPESGENRWALMFREYAQVDGSMIEILRDGQPERSQNPLIRFDLNQALKVPVEQLPWQTVPPQRKLEWSYTRRVNEGRPETGFTIAEAKRRLATSLGVSENQIEIIVRG